MKRGRMWLSAAMIGLVVSLILCGCAGSFDDDSKSSGAAPVTITYALWQTNLTDYMQERIAAFEAENPNIHVELKTYDAPNSFTAYWADMNGAEAADLPDAFQMSPTYLGTYEAQNKLLPIDDVLSAIDAGKLPKSLLEIYKKDGRQVGIPIDYDTIGLWYNMDLFDAAGIDYPNTSWTWDDLTAAAEKIDALSDDTYGIIACNKDQLGYFNTIAGCGGYVVKNDTDFGFSDPATIAGMQRWVDLRSYSPTLAQIKESGGTHALFMHGKAGMVYGGDWEAADFTSKDSQVADKINVTELPAMDGGKKAAIISGKANVISAATAHPKEAKKFLKFLSSAESYEKLGETGLLISAYGSYSDLFFKKYPQYDMGIFAREAVECSVAYPSSSTEGWIDVIKTHGEDMLNGTVSVQDGCAAIQSELTH